DVDGQGNTARFFVPTGVCFANGYVYVADAGNNKIKKIDGQGVVTTIAGSGTAGFADSSALLCKMNNPTDVVVDNNGVVYFADYGNHCIRKIQGGAVTTIAGLGGNSGDILGAAPAARFNRPRSLCMDGAGNIYIADLMNNKIKVLSATSNIVSLVAGSIQGYVDGAGASAEFYHPTGIDIDMWGNLVIADAGNNCVRRCTLAGVVSTLAGTGASGYADGPVLSSTFNDVEGISADAQGNVYVGDKANNVIRKLTTVDVGVFAPVNSMDLLLFPNPVTDKLIIRDNAGDDALSLVQIFSVEGRLVKQISVGEYKGDFTIDISDLAAGLYDVVATTQNDNVLSSRITKE
ncbi:MAG TPA: T9SS type A sorting domain-containing protein, partial [Bacteroidia bacterium]|nr:T9SS type A sorting domain-containing protein [Bacteroidia bacterium]